MLTALALVWLVGISHVEPTAVWAAIGVPRGVLVTDTAGSRLNWGNATYNSKTIAVSGKIGSCSCYTAINFNITGYAWKDTGVRQIRIKLNFGYATEINYDYAYIGSTKYTGSSAAMVDEYFWANPASTTFELKYTTDGSIIAPGWGLLDGLFVTSFGPLLETGAAFTNGPSWVHSTNMLYSGTDGGWRYLANCDGTNPCAYVKLNVNTGTTASPKAANISTTFNVTTSTTISWAWKVDSEASYDFLSVLLDGIITSQIHGLSSNWMTNSLTVTTPGTYTLAFSMTRDNFDPSPTWLNQGWIKNFQMVSAACIVIGCAQCANGVSTCTQCSIGFALSTTTSCATCTAGSYYSSSNVPCQTCTSMTGCSGTITCTSSTTSVCSLCADGYFKSSTGICIQCAVLDGCTTANTRCSLSSGSTQTASTCASCSTGYSASGSVCVDTDACASVPCTYGFCTDLPPPADITTGRKCTCNAGYTNFQGIPYQACVAIDACVTTPCDDASAATCLDLPAPATDGFTGRACSCRAGYIGPGEVNACLKLTPGAITAPTGALTALSAGTLITFSVAVYGTSVSQAQLNNITVTEVRYDSDLTASKSLSGAGFLCPFVSLTATNPLAVTCRLTSGVGQDYSFFVVYCIKFGGQQICNTSPRATVTGSKFSFDGPPMIYGCLELGIQTTPFADISQTPTCAPISQTQSSDLLSFYATKWVLDSAQCQITYGPTSSPSKYPCALAMVSSNVTNNVIACQTYEAGQGSDNVFVVTCAGRTSLPSTFKFDQTFVPPILTSVTGCAETSGNIATGCPTSGGNTVVLTGSNFASGQSSILIGGKVCVLSGLQNTTRLQCLLPVGTGMNKSVVVLSNNQLSLAQPLLSYAAPDITSIVGGTNCSHSKNATSGVFNIDFCSRSGGGKLTITGTNFGQSGVTVLIGGVMCGSLEHSQGKEHTAVTCALPAGSDQLAPVVLTAYQGDPSPQQVYLSYAVCAPGYVQPSVDPTCDKCPSGTFAAEWGRLGSCTPCGSGKYSDAKGATTCKACAAGTYQRQSSTSYCDDCAAGTFSKDDASFACENCTQGAALSTPRGTECKQCSPGKYQNLIGQKACVDCLPGAVTADNATVDCHPCAPGSAAPYGGAQKCTPCDLGLFQSLEGKMQCEDCAPGTYSNEQGRADCVPCEAGRFAASNRSIICQLCAIGTAAGAEGSATCRKCNPGYYTAALGQAMCLTCPVGKFNSNTTAADQGCLLCDPGRYQNTTGATECVNCESGKFTPGTGSIDCLSCPQGTFSNASNVSSSVSVGGGKQGPAPIHGALVCQSCTEGRYQDGVGASQCKICGLGKYSPGQGAGECKSCPVGRFSALDEDAPEGAIDCSLCAKGSFQDGMNAFKCKSCGVGKYSPGEGAAECKLCPVGRFSTLTENSTEVATDCELCPKGHFQNETGAWDCTECAVGKYQGSAGSYACDLCDVGRSAFQQGQFECAQCPAGTHKATTGAAECDVCAAGEYSNLGDAGCSVCKEGRYTPRENLSACTLCEAGRFQDKKQQMTCLPCPAGLTSETEAMMCKACPEKQVSPLEGMAACVICPHITVPIGNTACICPTGTFARNTYQAQAQQGVFNLSVSCEDCPRGANCDGQGTTLQTLTIDPGWWRESNTSTNLYQCLYSSHCMGGNGAKVCGAHRIGVLCGQCEENYKSSGKGGACEPCAEDHGTDIASMILIVIAVTALLIFMYFLVFRLDAKRERQARVYLHLDVGSKSFSGSFNMGGSSRSKNSKSKENEDNEWERGSLDTSSSGLAAPISSRNNDPRYSSQTLKVMSPGLARVGSGAFTDQDLRSSVLDIDKEEYVTQAKTYSNMPNFMYKSKIFISFLQVAMHAVEQGDIVWPSYFQAFISKFAFFSFDFIPWQSLSCATELNYISKAWMVAVLPLVILFFLIVCYFVPLSIMASRDMSDIGIKRNRNILAQKKFVKLLLFTIFLIYPYVSSTLLGAFNCITVQGHSYLVADVTIHCDDSKYLQSTMPLLFFVLLYPIGIPVLYFYRLYKARNNLRNKLVELELGFLYLACTHNHWYFECVDMTFKLTMTSVLDFLPNRLELRGGMLVVTGYLVFVLVLNPFKRKGDFRLQLLALNELLMIYFIGFLVQGEGVSLSESMDILLSIPLITLVIFLFLVFFVMSAKNAFKLGRAYCRKRRLKELSSQTESQDESHHSVSAIGSQFRTNLTHNNPASGRLSLKPTSNFPELSAAPKMM